VGFDVEQRSLVEAVVAECKTKEQMPFDVERS